MQSSNIWRQNGTTYSPSSTATNMDTIPGGVYAYEQSMFGWYLNRKGDSFGFPYKIYGNHNHILDRIKKAWKSLDGSIGVLLNGVKGTGKTVTAQLAGNWAISEGIPVVVISEVVPIENILGHTNQPIMFIFDEFEKVYAEMEHQQTLLTALDGMSRSKHKHLFIFTTNEKTIENNLIDRPSRIRYCWEFTRLGMDVVEDLMDDLLDPSLARYRSDIASYLETRQVCSIDVAKTVINEVNAFREPPSEFAAAMNLTERSASGYRLTELTDSGPGVVLAEYFAPKKKISKYLTVSGAEDFVRTHTSSGHTETLADMHTGSAIRLVGPNLENPQEWVVNLQVPVRHTWIAQCPALLGHLDRCMVRALWLQEAPDGWQIPEWARCFGERPLTDEAEEELDDIIYNKTMYGPEEQNKKLRILIEPIYTKEFARYDYKAL